MRFSLFWAFVALVVALSTTTQFALAVPCGPFPGTWTGDPATNSSLTSWIGSVYDHNSGCDSPIVSVTLNLASTSNETSVQVYIAERTDTNSTVSNPILVYDFDFVGDSKFQNFSFGSTEEVNPFTFKSNGKYLIIVKSTTGGDDAIGVDDTNGYAMWQITQSNLPGSADVWTTTLNKKVRVWFHLMPSCNGILADQANACSGHGHCIGFDLCACNTGFEGTFCNSTQGSSASSSAAASSADAASSSSSGGGGGGGEDNAMVIVISAISAVVVIVIILIVIVIVIVAIVAGVIYYNQHRYPLPRTYSRPFAEMPGKDTDFSPMAI